MSRVEVGRHQRPGEDDERRRVKRSRDEDVLDALALLASSRPSVASSLDGGGVFMRGFEVVMTIYAIVSSRCQHRGMLNYVSGECGPRAIIHHWTTRPLQMFLFVLFVFVFVMFRC